jgi:hypothetical protein
VSSEVTDQINQTFIAFERGGVLVNGDDDVRFKGLTFDDDDNSDAAITWEPLVYKNVHQKPIITKQINKTRQHRTRRVFRHSLAQY